MQFHTYILESEKSGMLHIGQTSDVEKRLTRHNAGGSRFTKGKGPWKLLFSISFETKTEAILMEKKLKGYKNPDRIREWINTQQTK